MHWNVARGEREREREPASWHYYFLGVRLDKRALLRHTARQFRSSRRGSDQLMNAPLPGGSGPAIPSSGPPANAASATPPPSGPFAAIGAPARWLILGINIGLLAFCATMSGSLMLFPPAHAAIPGAIPTATVFSGAPAISTGIGVFPSATPSRTPHRRATPTHSGGGPPVPTATASATPRPTVPSQPTATPTITPIPATPTPTNTPPEGT
jgi:hypothetical protein